MKLGHCTQFQNLQIYILSFHETELIVTLLTTDIEVEPSITNLSYLGMKLGRPWGKDPEIELI